jgi:PIN domain nuclease of toxin-antitoxin system
MNLLLDTHALLWFATGDRRLSRPARKAMEAHTAVLQISPATVWELSIKASLGRLVLPSTVQAYVAEKLEEGYRMLPLTWTHATAVERLPFHHRDPFDRLLAAQALAEQVPVVTRDRIFRAYGVTVVW